MEPRQTYSIGGVVLNGQGRVLVVSQHGTSWSLPKGHVESGEDEETTARREIYEESGITHLEFVRTLGSYQRHMITDDGKGEDRSELKNITMLLFTTEEIEIAPRDPENPEARWVNRDEVADLLTHPKDKEFFESIKKDL